MAISINSNLNNPQTKYVTDSEQVKGAPIIVATKTDLATIITSYPRTMVEGRKAYVKDENAEYRYVKNTEEQLEWKKIEVSADEPIFVINLRLGGTLERPTAIVESDNIYADLIEFKNTKGYYPKVVGQIDLSVLQQGMLDFEISSFTTYQDRIYLRCNVINTNVVITRYFVLEDMLLEFGAEPEHKYANIKIVEPWKVEPVYHHHIRVFRQANKTSGDEPHTQAHPSFVLYLNLVSKIKEVVTNVTELIQAIYEHMLEVEITSGFKLLGGGVMKYRKDGTWDGEIVTYDLIGIEVNSNHNFRFIIGSSANLADDYVAATTTDYEVSTMDDCFLTDDVI